MSDISMLNTQIRYKLLSSARIISANYSCIIPNSENNCNKHLQNNTGHSLLWFEAEHAKSDSEEKKEKPDKET